MITFKFEPQVQGELPHFSEVIETFKKTLNRPEIGFFSLSNETRHLKASEEVFAKFKTKKTFYHIGIGGSSLGPEMLIKALAPMKAQDFVFINNIDSNTLFYQLQNIRFEDSIFYIVSKSGTTAETIATLSIIQNLMAKAGITAQEWKKYFVFCTDPVIGDLRLLAHEYGISCLEVPANVGGRFSVLTSVGLFPALFAGINVKDFLRGAEDIKTSLLKEDWKTNTLFPLAMTLAQKAPAENSTTVMMPYSSLLRDFSSWFVQLWGESLGKDEKGLTPLPAYGATDQHSQTQLFMEGPRDKFLLLVGIMKREHDYPLKSSLSLNSFQKLSSFSLDELMQAEYAGTLKALSQANRPYCALELPVLDSYHLGQLILYFECLTVAVAQLLKIDPFNQPGVELGKKYAYEWLTSIQKSR